MGRGCGGHAPLDRARESLGGLVAEVRAAGSVRIAVVPTNRAAPAARDYGRFAPGRVRRCWPPQGAVGIDPSLFELSHVCLGPVARAGEESLGLPPDRRFGSIQGRKQFPDVGGTRRDPRGHDDLSLRVDGGLVVPFLRGMLSFNHSDIAGLLSEVAGASDLHTHMRAARCPC